MIQYNQKNGRSPTTAKMNYNIKLFGGTDMKYKEFTDKKNAIEFAKENGGYYEIVVDDRANNIYIVFYR